VPIEIEFIFSNQDQNLNLNFIIEVFRGAKAENSKVFKNRI